MKKACFFAALVIGGLSTLCCAYSGGDGSSGNPYQIADANDLNAIGLHSEDWGKCFILTDDIDMSVFTGTQYNIIGNYTTKFTGTFDGNGYVIQNLTYSTTDVVHYVGLFGVTSNATIQNLGLENVLIASGGSQIGGIVGNNSGKISNSYASGTVIGRFYIGGLVGYNSGVINNCYSTDIVNGSSDSNYIGGLIGYNQAGTVKLCYSAGFVSGYSFVGGFIGYKSGGTIENCFWDIQTSGQSGSDGGTGKTTVEMMTRSTFVSAGWDFSSRWIDGDF